MLDLHAFINRNTFIPAAFAIILMFLFLFLQATSNYNGLDWQVPVKFFLGWYVGGYFQWLLAGQPVRPSYTVYDNKSLASVIEGNRHVFSDLNRN